MEHLLESANNLTEEWLEERLLPHYGRLSIASFSCTSASETLHLCQVFKVSVAFNTLITDAPESFILKIHSAIPPFQQFAKAMKFYEREYVFYRHLASEAGSTLKLPRLFAGFLNEEGSKTTLLLEDLTLSGFKTGSREIKCSKEVALRAIETLALVHASFWTTESNNSKLMSHAMKLDNPQFKQSFAGYEKMIPVFRSFREDLLKTMPQVAAVFADEKGLSNSIESFIEETSSGEDMKQGYTIHHGDYKLENIMLSEKSVAVIDWQTYCVGGFMTSAMDLVHFVVNNLEVEDRKAWQNQLLEAYHQVFMEHLKSRGIEGIKYSLEDLERNYKRAVIWEVLLLIFATYRYTTHAAKQKEMTVESEKATSRMNNQFERVISIVNEVKKVVF